MTETVVIIGNTNHISLIYFIDVDTTLKKALYLTFTPLNVTYSQKYGAVSTLSPYKKQLGFPSCLSTPQNTRGCRMTHIKS